MKKLFFSLPLILLVGFFSCHQSSKTTAWSDDSLYKAAKAVFDTVPLVADNQANPVTEAKVHLGKVLFFDTRLSARGNNSCNSCHNLATFGVDNQPTSTGDAGQKGNRNSPTVLNAALRSAQFWDGRAKDVEEQAAMPILNTVEMGMPHKDMVTTRLSRDNTYHKLFRQAFPKEKEPIQMANVQKAIAAFERTLITPSSFDQYLQGHMNAITTEEKAGLQLFIQSGCTSCHNGVGIGGNGMQKFGVTTDYRKLTHINNPDAGKMAVTKNPADKDVFMIAGLRNVQGTYPYFHDGSVHSLDSAVKIMAKAQLDKQLNEKQISEIVAFLRTLTGRMDPRDKRPPVELQKPMISKGL
jgi:cytochrome c peroxidase